MEEVWGRGFEDGLNPELEAKMMDHLQVCLAKPTTCLLDVPSALAGVLFEGQQWQLCMTRQTLQHVSTWDTGIKLRAIELR